jgi:multiple antibiotic resistance protein
MVPTSNLSSDFVTLLVTIGPIETAAVFAGLSAGFTPQERKGLAKRAVAIAGGVMTLFGIAGATVLSLLHVSMPAFRVAGGVLLFLQALTLTFASPGLSSINEGERREAQGAGDMAVFPLAFPLIAGPGSLSAIVLLEGRATSWAAEIAVFASLLVCLALTYLAMRLSGPLTRWLGKTGADVVGRVSGVLLAALAVQFVFDGLRQAGL